MTKRNAYILLLVAFVIAVAIRVPTLTREVSIWRDYNTAFFLIPMIIWNDTGGPAQYSFMHVATFSNEADKNNTQLGSLTKDGICYYHSFPTFSLVFPYVIFKGLKISFEPISIRILNLLLGIITIVLIFNILFTLLPYSDSKDRVIGAFSGSIVYLFSPGSLFYHGNGYTHHVMVVPLLLTSIFFFVKYWQNEEKKDIILLCLFLFLTQVTEWIGYFFAAILFFIVLFSRKNNKFVLLSAIILTTLIAIICFVYPPVTQFGLNNFLEQLIHKFNERSLTGNVVDTSFISVLHGLFQHFKTMHFTVALLLATLSLALTYKRKRFNLSRLEITVFAVLILASWMHHVIFLNFTLPHDYSVLIDLSYLSIFSGCIVVRLLSEKKLIISVGAVFIALSIAQYFYYNRIGEESIDGEPYSYVKQMADAILKESNSNDTIFIQSFTNNTPFCPPLVYHLKRNYFTFYSEEDLRRLLEEKQVSSYIIVYVNNHQVSQIKHKL